MAEIFYTVSPDLCRMARLERGDVVELDFEIPGKAPSLLGNIYWGRVVDVQKPLSVAFVDIGEAKLGMLPLREGKLAAVKQGDALLVQVSRTENPLEDKGVRLTRLIVLTLGSLLYTPFTPGLSLSKKLKERESFKDLLTLHPGEGVIIRYGASLKDPVQTWLLQLRNEWAEIQRKLSLKPPLCISPAPDLFSRLLRGLSSSDRLVVDDQKLAIRMKEKVTFSRMPAFDERSEEAWESLFSSEIAFPEGGNLYIEETRGLVVIDVNSQGALRHSLSFNKMALREVLRQIRLRDLGGKIVVDLIQAPKTMENLLQGLPLPSNLSVWGISLMGLLEMTRRRKRLSLPQRLKLQLN
ncbi:MAG: ribonuclease E/G [Alphaproteobacteria bacterium]|nr:ribonuclease E/G [Alphaproteobacteria bacterium]